MNGTQPESDRRLARRHVLQRLGISAAGLALLACAAPAASPTPAAAPKTAPPPPSPAPAKPVAAAPTAAPSPAPPKPAPTVAPTARPSFGTVKIHFPVKVGTMLPMYIATKRGYDKEEGFTAELIAAPSATGVRGMVAGEFDFTQSAGSAMAANLEGAPTRVIIVHVGESLFWLYSKPEIKTVQDLRGRSIAVDDVGSTLQVVSKLFLLRNGLDENAVTFLAAGGGGGPTRAIVGGAADAAVVGTPDDVKLQKLGSFNNIGFIGDVLPSPSSGLATSEKLIRERPDLGRAVTKAAMRAHHFLRQDRAGSVPIIIEYLSLAEDETSGYYESFVPRLTRDGKISVDQQNASIKAQAEVLKVARIPRPEEVYDFRFLD